MASGVRYRKERTEKLNTKKDMNMLPAPQVAPVRHPTSSAVSCISLLASSGHLSPIGKTKTRQSG